jgi:hypothetical protein
MEKFAICNNITGFVNVTDPVTNITSRVLLPECQTYLNCQISMCFFAIITMILGFYLLFVQSCYGPSKGKPNELKEKTVAAAIGISQETLETLTKTFNTSAPALGTVLSIITVSLGPGTTSTISGVAYIILAVTLVAGTFATLFAKATMKTTSEKADDAAKNSIV